MQRALLAAVFTGLAAPAVGTYLVQRRLALMGDGIGHVAVTGVALGLLTGASPTLDRGRGRDRSARSLIEVIRERGHANGDVALALLFYGGIAGGVLITGLAGAERAPRCSRTCSARSPRSRSRDVLVTMALAARGDRRLRRPAPAAVRGHPGRGVRPGRRAQRARLQHAGRGARRGHGHRRDAHRRAAAGLAR